MDPWMDGCLGGWMNGLIDLWMSRGVDECCSLPPPTLPHLSGK